MVIKMSGDQRNVNVATLADGLAVVHGFENRQEPRMLLYQPRNGVQITRARMRCQRPPSRRGRPRGFDCGVDVRRRALRNGSESLAARRIDGVEVFARCGCLPSAADEMLKAVAMALQPGDRFFGIFRSGTVFHAHELFGYAHGVCSIPSSNSN